MTRVPDWKLERYALGELSVDELETVRRQLEQEEGGLERLARLESSNHEILMSHPPRTVVPAIRERAGRPARARKRAWLAVPLAVGAALGLLLVVNPRTTPPPTMDDQYIGVKGDATLTVSRQVGDGEERLESGVQASAGDVLQLSYQAGGWPYGVILSVDGAGTVTLHYPEDGGDTALDVDGRVNLPTAYRLDDAPDFERFVMVTGTTPLDVGQILSAAEELDPARAASASLPLPADLHQTTLTLWKTP